jgi:predicted NAD-dependent protein-ADP-ribosyltransferase YbiA (DUF1768 family)
VKRRKSKKASPSTFQGAPEPEEGEDTELAAAPDELEEEDWIEEAQAALVTTEAPQKGRAATRHLVKDFSYVRGEVMRILGLATFLVASLLITAVLRN